MRSFNEPPLVIELCASEADMPVPSLRAAVIAEGEAGCSAAELSALGCSRSPPADATAAAVAGAAPPPSARSLASCSSFNFCLCDHVRPPPTGLGLIGGGALAGPELKSASLSLRDRAEGSSAASDAALALARVGDEGDGLAEGTEGAEVGGATLGSAGFSAMGETADVAAGAGSSTGFADGSSVAASVGAIPGSDPAEGSSSICTTKSCPVNYISVAAYLWEASRSRPVQSLADQPILIIIRRSCYSDPACQPQIAQSVFPMVCDSSTSTSVVVLSALARCIDKQRGSRQRTDVSSFANDRSVAWGDLYFNLHQSALAYRDHDEE